ncbi:SDR family oxidoreductase [Sphingobium sufflavum]|uniref:SDR family NAD(P)-dependent oxidoreductase n=1 Tax=Sphingobium sufflavum TaxID=1129547 RepID=UPI001F3840DF|nr:SDR family oxidoreductase [Sphingobium sufflavum]MCE7795928.1 SDR family oxidoreductase [Sphingobium sufflavum]
MSQEFRDLYGPTALVTGASSGIGRAFAEELAARGVNLILVARRIDRLEVLAERLEDKHRISVMPLEVDLADPTATARILNATASVDVGLLVSNAGFGSKGPFEADDPAVMTQMLAVNAQATMLLAHGFAPRLKARGRGGIILTSSVEGLIGCPYSAVYSATKAFVNALGEALWGELTPEGIDVLTLCPGATESEAAAKQGLDPAAMTNQQAPEEVARLTLDNLRNGPTYIPHAHYKAMFEQILAMPRPQALVAMAKGMKKPG